MPRHGEYLRLEPGRTARRRPRKDGFRLVFVVAGEGHVFVGKDRLRIGTNDFVMVPSGLPCGFEADAEALELYSTQVPPHLENAEGRTWWHSCPHRHDARARHGLVEV